MKSTSRLRRVDDLGRVVIPKEIREKLRLKTGASVEVFCEEESVVIKKFSVVKEISNFAEKCVKSFDDFKDFAIFICDNKTILAKNELCKTFEKEIPNELFEIIQKGEIQIFSNNKFDFKIQFLKQAVFPINNQGENCGAIVVMSKTFVDNFDFVLPIKNLLENYINN